MNQDLEKNVEFMSRHSLLPEKSKDLYEKTYQEFVKWCAHKEVKSYSESVLLEYFTEKSSNRKASTLWSYYSMLKTTLLIHQNVDIRKFGRLLSFLKGKASGYKPKKSKILTRDQVEVFLLSAPDDAYLMIKVALIFGLAGACRRQELTQLTTDDIQDLGPSLLITIREEWTQKQRLFTIASPIFIEIYRKYAALRPPKTAHRRFFLSYRDGKCSKQVVGKNVFGQLPNKIATFLQLPNPEEYTGHCFRRSSANLLEKEVKMPRNFCLSIENPSTSSVLKPSVKREVFEYSEDEHTNGVCYSDYFEDEGDFSEKQTQTSPCHHSESNVDYKELYIELLQENHMLKAAVNALRMSSETQNYEVEILPVGKRPRIA